MSDFRLQIGDCGLYMFIYDIAAVVLFLAGEEAQWITGQLIQAHEGFGTMNVR